MGVLDWLIAAAIAGAIAGALSKATGQEQMHCSRINKVRRSILVVK